MREAIELLARAGRNDLATDLNRIQARVDFEDLDVLRCVGTDQNSGWHPRSAVLLRTDRSAWQARQGDEPQPLYAPRDQRGIFHQLLDEGAHHLLRGLDLSLRRSPLLRDRSCWPRLPRHRPRLLLGSLRSATRPASRPSGKTRWRMALGRRATRARSSPSVVTRSPSRSARRSIPKSFAIASSGTRMIFSISASTSPTASAGSLPTIGPTRSTPRTTSSTSCAPWPSGPPRTNSASRSYQYGSYTTLERSICGLFRTKTVVQAAILATRIGLLADAPLTKADILAAHDETAVGRLIMQPTGAPLRRLARLRAPAPETGGMASSRRLAGRCRRSHGTSAK